MIPKSEQAEEEKGRERNVKNTENIFQIESSCIENDEAVNLQLYCQLLYYHKVKICNRPHEPTKDRNIEKSQKTQGTQRW